jgi:hypothetical protein
MKLIRNVFGLLMLIGFISSSNLLHAQDSIIIVTAQSQGLNLVSPADLPDSGTFWMVTSNDVFSPNPCPPQDTSLPVFQITDGQFLVDATGGQVTTEDGQSVKDAVAALADDVQNLISQIQGTTPSRNLSRGGAHAMDDIDPNDSGDGGTNTYTPNVPAYYTPTTNDLWLQIIAKTNTAAFLIIHPPWNVTNGVWGLYFTTNIAVPYDNWTWLLKTAPGETNLVVTNLPTPLGFFMLGPPAAIRDGFTNNSLAPNDDGSTDSVLIGFDINFFGASYTNLYVNNNGNVTFDDLLSAYTPDLLAVLVNNNFADNFGPTNIIAPFWADVDTRMAGATAYGTNTVDGRAAFGVSWIDVGYFDEKDDKTNSFQLIMIDRSDRTNGDFDLEFNYSRIQWETGDVSGGMDGLGGSSARAGYASANVSTNLSFELNGSGVNGAFLDSNAASGLIYTNFNSTVPGRYVFQFHNGAPLGHP